MLPPRGAREKVQLWAERTPDGDIALAAMDAAPGGRELRLTPKQQGLLQHLPRFAGNDLPSLRRLEARGFVAIGPAGRRRAPQHHAVGARKPPPQLNPEQQAAVDAITAAPDGDRLLLHGVTGSGKTEVYLRAAADTLARGRGVLILVPEIGLTPQMIDRFVTRFGDTVAVLHSKLGAGERYDEWRRLKSGAARVCVGPRSAVFAPIEHLGLVVVDEEHDGSYKNEGDPRYDARLVAEQRAAQHGAVLVCGSATPRPESVHALRRIRLPHRVDGAPLPPVEIVDLKAAHGAVAPADPRGAGRRAQGHRAAQPPRLVELPHLSDLRARVGVPAVRRRADPAPRPERRRLPSLRPPRADPATCPDCGSVSIARHGAGTERLEHDLAALGKPGAAPGRRRQGRRRGAQRLRARRPGDPRRDPGRRQGPRLPGRRPRRRPGRRLHAALPGLPRRGADVRARHPARRPRGPRRRRPRDRPDDRPARERDRLRRPARQRRLPGRGARAPRAAALPAVLDADPRRLRLRAARRGAPRGDRGPGAPAASLGPAPLFKPPRQGARRRSWSRPASAAARSTRSTPRSARSAPTRPTRAWRSRSTWTRSSRHLARRGRVPRPWGRDVDRARARRADRRLGGAPPGLRLRAERQQPSRRVGGDLRRRRRVVGQRARPGHPADRLAQGPGAGAARGPDEPGHRMLDVGPGPDGALWVVYPKCTNNNKRCRIWGYDLRTHRARDLDVGEGDAAASLAARGGGPAPAATERAVGAVHGDGRPGRAASPAAADPRRLRVRRPDRPRPPRRPRRPARAGRAATTSAPRCSPSARSPTPST